MLLRPAPAANASSSPLDLVREANHRIANSLSVLVGLVKLRESSLRKSVRSMSREEVLLILKEFSGRLETVARLHRLLADERPVDSIDVADYLREIAEGVVRSLSSAAETELHFVTDGRCVLPTDSARSIGLIVAELVTNAIKYAHPSGVAGEITIACRECSGASLSIEVSDDGVGLPEGYDPLKSEQQGFRLIRTLADQVGAAISCRSNSLGFTLALQVPVAPPTQTLHPEWDLNAQAH
jgi:two-component sensor histidine kinase